MAEQEKKTLEELILTWEQLEIGREYPVKDNFCKHCFGRRLVFVVRLEATPGALAGVQLKTSARKRPWLVCKSCGRESKGKQP
ncbi:hypothetical protein [Streptomyces sp. NRRL F-4489]|uniref:hypothetical protein n=1 Tax=Streptomyces sp. NRRL F-4489 TaxID=1609095 RepID=UPI000AB21B42|nr:hypothetical protein [Streptomyces sp. NRRL F-4489]